MKHEKSGGRVTVSVDIAPMTLSIMERMQAAGMDTGREIDDMFIAFAEDLGWMKHDEEGNPVELLR